MSLMISRREVDSAAAGFVTESFYEGRGTGEEVDGSVGGYRPDAENGGGSSESSLTGAVDDSSLSLSEGEEVDSQMRKYPFGSMDSLEDALPVKRGLSNFFNGKSRSFAALSDVVTQPTTAGDLAKPEHPFNKRRRILMGSRSRWRRRASCSSLNTTATITLTLNPANLFSLEEEEEEDKDVRSQSPAPTSPSSSQSPPALGNNLPSFHERWFNDACGNNLSLRSTRSFSLGDLQHHSQPSSPE